MPFVLRWRSVWSVVDYHEDGKLAWIDWTMARPGKVTRKASAFRLCGIAGLWVGVGETEGGRRRSPTNTNPSLHPDWSLILGLHKIFLRKRQRWSTQLDPGSARVCLICKIHPFALCHTGSLQKGQDSELPAIPDPLGSLTPASHSWVLMDFCLLPCRAQLNPVSWI